MISRTAMILSASVGVAFAAVAFACLGSRDATQEQDDGVLVELARIRALLEAWQEEPMPRLQGARPAGSGVTAATTPEPSAPNPPPSENGTRSASRGEAPHERSPDPVQEASVYRGISRSALEEFKTDLTFRIVTSSQATGPQLRYVERLLKEIEAAESLAALRNIAYRERELLRSGYVPERHWNPEHPEYER